jgi:hypothetical protein
MAVRPMAAAARRDRRRTRRRPARCLWTPGGVGRRRRAPGRPARRRARDALDLDGVAGAGTLAATHRRPDRADRQRHREPLADHRAGHRFPTRRHRRRRRPHRTVRGDPGPGPVAFRSSPPSSPRPSSSRAVRCQQVAALCRFIAAHIGPGLPPVITGDLNAEPDADEVRLLGGHKTAPVVPGLVLVDDAWRYADPVAPGWTWDRRNPYVAATGEPSVRIDYVLVGLPRPAARARFGRPADRRPARERRLALRPRRRPGQAAAPKRRPPCPPLRCSSRAVGHGLGEASPRARVMPLISPVTMRRNSGRSGRRAAGRRRGSPSRWA